VGERSGTYLARLESDMTTKNEIWRPFLLLGHLDNLSFVLVSAILLVAFAGVKISSYLDKRAKRRNNQTK
jgi:hypothetical protein